MARTRLDWGLASRYADDPSRSPGLQLWRQFLRWQRSVNSLLAPLRITQSQFSILASASWLATRSDGGEVSQQDIADFAGMERMMVSQLVRRLERDGWLSRRPSHHDGRALSLHVTPKGEACLARALPLVEAHDAEFFGAETRTR